ncbi:uncharacterized protein CANTADRAFT_89347 [Suhomyces tanzawaensis NRRL Y-17324]|uniref:Fe2OG dioxygenase domain-containing protein n=1 Tax=Suhomyces tanzawaensis NRRL Y-17324 TaxID=984487 RepID=A0A1E4SJM7_9ASCO|nr:uncharacterized protein CANTADRAFT_89347 [Suhomyces tanzawaensis NRRL Y-17324]ODV79711.1 hypothetical protein CANTADRAFT_89347 [Suhomyces tanzawaensis NRRL Y-17324]
MPPKKSVAKQYTFPQNFLDVSNSAKTQFFKPQPQIVVSDQIITINNFFSKELCNELIKSFEKGLGLETTPLIKSKEYALRINDRAAVNDFGAAQAMWSYLRDILLQEVEYEDEELEEINDTFRDACGLNPQLRVYRYKKGHHFNQHYDESVVCARNESGSLKGRTKWTLLIYLTGDDEFEGGGTIFYPDYRGAEPLNVHPSKGMALLHKHGDDCLKHEGEIVRRGEKWILRSDVVYGMGSR